MWTRTRDRTEDSIKDTTVELSPRRREEESGVGEEGRDLGGQRIQKKKKTTSIDGTEQQEKKRTDDKKKKT